MKLAKKLSALNDRSRILSKSLDLCFEIYKEFYIELFQSGKKVHTMEGGFRMKIDVSESEPMLGRMLGTYESSVTEFLKDNLKQGDIYLDVGSNKGYHVLEASEIVGQSGKVIAVEPNPENLEDLRQNLSMNDAENVEIKEIALADENCESEFKTSIMSGTGEIVDGEEEGDFIVNLRSFDDLLEKEKLDKPTVIKIDVEGAERKTLRGMKKFLEEENVKLIVELHREKVEEEKFLSDLEELSLDTVKQKGDFYFLES
jgi:FkbM family methyltransferase